MSATRDELVFESGHLEYLGCIGGATARLPLYGGKGGHGGGRDGSGGQRGGGGGSSGGGSGSRGK